VLVTGVTYAAIFIVVAVLLCRFASEIVWRSLLVLFLFIAAGAYVVLPCPLGLAPFNPKTISSTTACRWYSDVRPVAILL
jgi:hypothetical protein